MTKRIQLEDHGQDFLWWDVDENGVVTDCGPFQGWLWEGTTVLNHADLAPGEILRIKTKYEDETTLNYRCREVQRVGWLKKDRQERFNLKRAWFVNAWRIVDHAGRDMIQPWSNTKTEARATAKATGITLLETA